MSILKPINILILSSYIIIMYSSIKRKYTLIALLLVMRKYNNTSYIQ